MSKQRVIKDEIWDDEWFYELDPSEKLVWLFLLTNPRNNIAGVYQLSRRWAANATGFDRDVFDNIMDRFESMEKIKTDGRWVVICNFHKHQAKNPKVEAGVVRILENIPKNIGILLDTDSLYIAYPTLLNSTLLNLSDCEANASANPTENNKKDMPWNTKSDDYEEGVVDLDGDGSLAEEKKPTKKYPNAPAVRKIFQEVTGKNPANWKVNKNQLIACENLVAERGLSKIKNALTFAHEHREDKYCPKINSPYDLDSKYQQLADYKLGL